MTTKSNDNVLGYIITRPRKDIDDFIQNLYFDGYYFTRLPNKILYMLPDPVEEYYTDHGVIYVIEYDSNMPYILY